VSFRRPGGRTDLAKVGRLLTDVIRTEPLLSGATYDVLERRGSAAISASPELRPFTA